MTQTITELIIYFAVVGFAGWLYETFVMTIWCGKWDNRGFMYGPVLPIYALGGLAATILFGFLIPEHTMIQVFVIGMVGSAVLEFITSYLLEKLFKRTWWDYSVCPGNVQGRICPPASVGFGLAALVVVYFINPRLFNLIDRVPTKFAVLLSLLYIAVFAADLAVTIYNLRTGAVNFRTYDMVNKKMDEFVDKHYRFDRTISEIVHEKADK